MSDPIDFSQFCYQDDEPSHTDLSNPVKRVKYNDPIPLKKVESKKPVKKTHTYVESTPVVPVGLTELYKTPNSPKELPLRLIIVGHNPSEQSFVKGHFYANPSNRMWFLLTKAGIVPKEFTCNQDVECPSQCGLGFTDLICGISETKSNHFTDSDVRNCKASLFERLQKHIDRVCEDCSVPVSVACPKIIAFSGVRQWKMLFPPSTVFDESDTGSSHSASSNILKNFFKSSSSSNTSSTDDTGSAANVDHSVVAKSVQAMRFGTHGQYGVQTLRPPGWPASLSNAIVFVLPSSSGAAAMTNDEREGPYMGLGDLLKTFPMYSENQEVGSD